MISTPLTQLHCSLLKQSHIRLYCWGVTMKRPAVSPPHAATSRPTRRSIHHSPEGTPTTPDLNHVQPVTITPMPSRLSQAEKVERLVDSARALSARLAPLQFSPPVEYVYNTFDYAFESYADYVRSYGGGPCEVLLLGMNPGPFGMAQTGVPFGDVPSVRDWMAVRDWSTAPGITLPAQHPKRLLLGHKCKNVERSGQRLWSLAKNRWASPEAFFSQVWVHNYCPLAFIRTSKNGTNFTPDKLRKEERLAVEAACDEALKEIIEILQPRVVVGVGLFAKQCAERCVPTGSNIIVSSILHPSPASPLGNGPGKWEAIAAEQLQELGVRLPDRRPDAISVP